MEELRKIIFSFLNKKKKSPKSLLKIKNIVYDYLDKTNNLFKIINEKDQEIPYIILESGEAVIIDGSVNEIQALFSCHLGIDIQQNKFAKELLNYIKHKTVISGEVKKLEKYSFIDEKNFYLSCGKKNMVTYINGKLTKVKNGYNGVIFDSEYCLAEWEPDCVELCPLEYLDPLDNLNEYNSFKINTFIPDGSHVYKEEMQHSVLVDWVIAALMKIKPLPILLFNGTKSSGKTLTSKALMKLFMGDSSNVSIFPNDKRSLMSCITSHFIYTIDNLDSKTPPWFNDTLTLASTGGELSERALFSNSTTYKKEIVTSVIITSRNAYFAKRDDIKDRILPIFFENRTDYSIPEDQLLFDITKNRNKILTKLFLEIYRLIDEDFHNEVFVEKYRFTKFGQLMQNRIKKLRRNYTINDLVKSVVNSQFNTLTDLDPLIQAIFEYDFKQFGKQSLSGTPLEIVKLLELTGKFSTNLKARVISRKIKENIDTFKINGWTVDTEKYGHSTRFHIYPPMEETCVSTSSNEINPTDV